MTLLGKLSALKKADAKITAAETKYAEKTNTVLNVFFLRAAVLTGVASLICSASSNLKHYTTNRQKSKDFFVGLFIKKVNLLACKSKFAPATKGVP